MSRWTRRRDAARERQGALDEEACLDETTARFWSPEVGEFEVRTAGGLNKAWAQAGLVERRMLAEDFCLRITGVRWGGAGAERGEGFLRDVSNLEAAVFWTGRVLLDPVTRLRWKNGQMF